MAGRVLVLKTMRRRDVAIGLIVCSILVGVGAVLTARGATSSEFLALGAGLFVLVIGTILALMVVSARIRPRRLRLEGPELTIEQPKLVGMTSSQILMVPEIKEAFVEIRTTPDMDLEDTHAYRVALRLESGETVCLTDFNAITDLDEARAFAGRIEAFLGVGKARP